jgi:hypothetical protein
MPMTPPRRGLTCHHPVRALPFRRRVWPKPSGSFARVSAANAALLGGRMAGIPGRSGGRNKLSVEQHLLAGTFRKDRHESPARATGPRLKANRGRRGVSETRLFPELTDILLLGWSAPRREYPAADAFLVFDFSHAALGRVWRRHRRVLLGEAARRSLSRPIWAEQQFDAPGKRD